MCIVWNISYGLTCQEVIAENVILTLILKDIFSTLKVTVIAICFSLNVNVCKESQSSFGFHHFTPAIYLYINMFPLLKSFSIPILFHIPVLFSPPFVIPNRL